jgi:hypothetical protein
LLIGGCASAPPSGPGILVLPGSGKSFDQFRVDEQQCRGHAHVQAGGKDAGQAASDAGVRSAVAGTAIGALVGAAFGGPDGAMVGAGFGLASGAMVGASASEAAGRNAQQRYDVGYQQCMYAKGHKVPVPPGQAARYRTPPPPPPPPSGVN